MLIICPQCGSSKDVSPENIPSNAVRTKCFSCGHTFLFRSVKNANAPGKTAVEIPAATPKFEKPPKEERNMSPIIKRPGIGSYFLALFFPPGYFFSRKRVGAGIVSLLLCIVALPLLLVFGLGLFIWLPVAGWALWSLRYELMDVHIKEQAVAIAEAMKREANK
ncbi:MAG: zinc-ribbon domain-containing protein [Thermodesulfobacteriota bacterium]